MTRPPAFILITFLMAIPACAPVTADLSTATTPRPPVGARLIAQPFSSNDASLAMDLDTYIASEPARVEARMRVEPDPRSRSLRLEWHSEAGSAGVHIRQLDGDQAPIRFTFPIRSLAAGEYSVVAVLRRNDGSEVRKKRRLMVVDERGAEPTWIEAMEPPGGY